MVMMDTYIWQEFTMYFLASLRFLFSSNGDGRQYNRYILYSRLALVTIYLNQFT